MVESATRRDLDERIGELMAVGWRTIDGATITSQERQAPRWVQFLYWSPDPIPLERVQTGLTPTVPLPRQPAYSTFSPKPCSRT
ncbi:MAG TPA: hypothetical protein VG734_10535 [Lacunisphaera sp.]|nr:hypothetical protein [Lacunisphaera sp.]